MQKVSYSVTNSLKRVLKFLGILISFGLVYILVRTTTKTLILDLFKMQPPNELIQLLEPYGFLVLLALFITLIYLPPFFQRRTRIYNEIDIDLYKEEGAKLKSSLDKIIKEVAQPHKSFFEITDKHAKTVYALIGNWRSGKTTLAGHLIKLLEKDDMFIGGGEYYHDTFNFGNINESTNAFFSNIANLTQVSEFNQLGYAATPKDELNATIGSVKLSRIFPLDNDLGYLRRRVQDKLIKQKKTYVIVIDDIDRLILGDQLQWLKTIELLGKFRGTLLLVVPINFKQVENNVKNSGLSKRYLEKILPNIINVGVDVDYIKRRFGIVGENSVPSVLARKYAKYMYCLALRICIEKLTNDSLLTKTIWLNDFASGAISKTALKFYDSLNSSRSSDTTLTLGLNSSYKIGEGSTLVFNDLKTFSNHNIVKLATDGFTAQSEDTNEFNIVRQRTLDWLLNIHTLQNIFEAVRVKQIDRGDIGPHSVDDAGWVDFWGDIGYAAVRRLDEDPALAQYFTYDIVSEEIDNLLTLNDESKEVGFFIELTRSGRLAN